MWNLTFVSLFAGCATSAVIAPSPGSRGPRADDDLGLARVETTRAREASSFPEVPRGDGTGRVAELAVAMPWSRTWDADEHRRAAAAARGAAGALEAEYEEACGARSADEVMVSPLQRYGLGGSPTSEGVIIALGPEAGPPDRLVADMRCHRAWMMLGRTEMDDCPLDLDGIRLDARGDDKGISVEITIRDRSLIPELQRRAAHDLEAGAKLRRVAR